jgi:hypothetical protein
MILELTTTISLGLTSSEASALNINGIPKIFQPHSSRYFTVLRKHMREINWGLSIGEIEVNMK